MSKYLMILSALFIGFWLWRSGRSHGEKSKAQPPKTSHKPPALQDMVSCSVCGLHLPQADAIKGSGDWYCCAEHRKLGAR